MMNKLYFFNWNTTDSTVKQHQQSNCQKLLENWQNTNKVFATTENFFDALILTHQTLANNSIMGGFLIFRALVKIASKMILLRVIAPRIAETISIWGEEETEPWSLALFHEDIING